MMPEPVKRIGRTLFGLDRSRWMTAVGCVCALALALQRLPFTADELLARSIELQVPQGGPASHVYSALQGHPTEVCEAFDARQPPVLDGIKAALVAIKAGTSFEALRIARLIGVYDRDVRALYLTPPASPSCWKEEANTAYFQAGFPIDAPFIWSMRRLGTSTIHVTAALMLGSWLGLVCLFLVARRLTGSAILGMLTVALGQYVWNAWTISGGGSFFVFNAFVPMYAGQLLCSSAPIVAARHWAVRWAAEGLLIALVALHSLLQIFVYPFTHRLNATVVLVIVAGCGLALWDRRVLVRAAVLAVALYAVMQPYYRSSKTLHAQLTNYNLAAGEAFTNVMIAMGMFERPTYLGLPNGDYAFSWIQDMDPYLLYTAPNLMAHQSLDYSGRTLVAETVLHRPLTLIEALWKRTLIQTAYHRELNPFWYYKHDRSAAVRGAAVLAALAVFGVICLRSLAYPSTWALLWPPAALIGWHLFGVNTLLTMVHLHVNYVFSGLFMLLSLTPVLALCVWRHRADPVARPLAALSAAARTLPSPMRWSAAAALAIVLGFGASYVARESRKEVTAFWLWYAIHYAADFGPIGQDAWRSPAQLAAGVRRLEAFGHEPPGAVEMYATWIFWVYNYQNGLYKRGPATHDVALQAQYKAEADSYMHAFYRQALQKAQPDPHFGSYALMLNDPDWPNIFRRSLAAAPTHHHAAYMAYHLIGQEPDRESVLRIIHIYDTQTARLLEATAANRPGYVRLPAITGPRVEPDPAGELFRLSPGGSPAMLPAIPLRGAPKLRVGVYLEVRAGGIHVTALPDASHVSAAVHCSAIDLSSQTIEHYWHVDCDGLNGVEAIQLSVAATGKDATVVVRDYYPMFTTVRVAS